MAFEETVDVQGFIDTYAPDAPVAFNNGMQTTLAQALAAEALFCTADDERRLDPAKRLGYLAQILAAGGSLRPEDEQYLPPAVAVESE